MVIIPGDAAALKAWVRERVPFKAPGRPNHRPRAGRPSCNRARPKRHSRPRRLRRPWRPFPSHPSVTSKHRSPRITELRAGAEDRRPAQLAAMPAVAAAGATVGVVCAGHAGDGGAAAEPATVGLDAGHVATIATDCARLTDRGACTDTTIATALGAVVGDLTDLARPLSSRRRGTVDLDVADSGTGVHAVLRAHPARRSPEGRCEEREFHQPGKRARVHAQVMLTSGSGIQARRPRRPGERPSPGCRHQAG